MSPTGKAPVPGKRKFKLGTGVKTAGIVAGGLAADALTDHVSTKLAAKYLPGKAWAPVASRVAAGGLTGFAMTKAAMRMGRGGKSR